jgi:histidine triad (HIT) family protein
MGNDFYCDEVLSGKLAVTRVRETDEVLAFHHTRPSYPVHIVVIPKRHITSLIHLKPEDDALLVELLHVIQSIASEVFASHGACRVITNVGAYQDTKHLHWHIVAGTS